MVKVGEHEKHIKYVKTRKFYEIRGEILQSKGTEGNMETGKIGGNSKFVVNEKKGRRKR